MNAVLRFLFLHLYAKYQKVAIAEVAAAYGISFDDAQILLQDMTRKGMIKQIKVGNGLFFTLPSQLQECDALSGACSI